MRLALAFLLAIGLQSVFGAASAQQSLKALVKEMSERWPPPSQDIEMTITWRRGNGTELLHCRIVNTSSHVLQLDNSLLPWNAPYLMVVTVLNAGGSLVFSNRNLPVEQLISAPRVVWAISPRQAVEGDIDLSRLPFYGAAAHEDLLVMWSRQINLYTGAKVSNVGLPVSGITFVPKHQSPGLVGNSRCRLTIVGGGRDSR
jgi:hypothetical protein